MNIGIIGHGIVGKAIEVGFRDHTKIFINDPKLGDKSISKAAIVTDCEFIFVGVPTPYNVKEKCVDDSIITGIIDELDQLAYTFHNNPIVIVKSAIVPRVVKEWINDCYSIQLVISPEYLTERSFHHDFVNQKVMVLGGLEKNCQKVVELYRDYSICNRQCKIGICSAEEAALIKYMENSFLAMKCIFNNQFKRFYDKHFKTELHDGFNQLMDVFYLDERMGLFPFKYRVPGPDGDFGYGGKCLPKDVQAIIHEGNNQGTPLTLLERVVEINNIIRTNRDWEFIQGALS